MSANIITNNRWGTVSADTLQSALNILDAQYNHCQCRQTATESQKAYYEGMKAMMDILLSEHYEHLVFVDYNQFTQTHFICEHD